MPTPYPTLQTVVPIVPVTAGEVAALRVDFLASVPTPAPLRVSRSLH